MVLCCLLLTSLASCHVHSLHPLIRGVLQRFTTQSPSALQPPFPSCRSAPPISLAPQRSWCIVCRSCAPAEYPPWTLTCFLSRSLFPPKVPPQGFDKWAWALFAISLAQFGRSRRSVHHDVLMHWFLVLRFFVLVWL